jgi:hypothetical protein
MERDMNHAANLDELDARYPVPSDISPATRPYEWEADESPAATADVWSRGFGVDDIVLKYWQNSSGGEGWAWVLAFATLREALDFLCAAASSLSLDDEDDWFDEDLDDDLDDDLDEDGDDEEGDPELDEAAASVTSNEPHWKRRLGVLENVRRGMSIPEAVEPFLAELDLPGDIEFFDTARELLEGNTAEAQSWRLDVADSEAAITEENAKRFIRMVCEYRA